MEARSRDGGTLGDRRIEIDGTPLTVLLVLAALAAVQLVHHYPNLPGTITTHFGVSGQADGWSVKQSFFPTYGIIEAAMVVAAFLMARFAARIPTGALNIPNRDYWLAPERRSESLRFVWSQILWIEAATPSPGRRSDSVNHPTAPKAQPSRSRTFPSFVRTRTVPSPPRICPVAECSSFSYSSRSGTSTLMRPSSAVTRNS